MLTLSNPFFVDETIGCDSDDIGSKTVVGADRQVQNDEISSTKEFDSEPIVKDLVKNEGKKVKGIELVDDSITISDEEDSEDESEPEDIVENASNTAETKCGDEALTNKPIDVVCVHIESLRVSNKPSISLTQIGCASALNSKQEKYEFFQPIKPDSLQNFLDNFKMESDLLKALHMTSNDDGKFEFRAQFEIKRKEKNKIFAVTEEEALRKLTFYLQELSNVVLVAVDEETVQVLKAKYSEINTNSETKLPFVSFTTWSRVLNYFIQQKSIILGEDEFELEEFYNKFCGDISGYINALDVANFLKKSVGKLWKDFAKMQLSKFGKFEVNKNDFIQQILENICNLEEKIYNPIDLNSSLTVSVYNSFRPAVATKIGIEKMDTVQLSSGEESEDSDIELVECVKKDRNISTKRKYASKNHNFLAQKRRSFNLPDNPIVISSDEEEEEEEFSLDENVSFSGEDKDNLIPNFSATCQVCKLDFEDFIGLESHISMDHFECPDCKMSFNNLQDSVQHMKLHDVHLSVEKLKQIKELAASRKNT